MKRLIAITTLVLSLNSFAGVVECGNIKAGAKTFYPVNKLALQIAADLNVKTCGGKRFNFEVKKLKHTKKRNRITYAKMLELRKQLTKTKTSNGFGF